MDKKIRVLAAKPGLDGHDRGVKVVTSALMDAGSHAISIETERSWKIFKP